MRLIHALQLRTKLKILFILIGSGLALVAIVGYINITSMKQNLDDLYYGSFTPVNELNDLLLTYNKGVEITVFQLRNGHLSPFEASALLSESLDKVHRVWNAYRSHYRSEREKEYIDYATMTMERANRHIVRIIDVCHQGINISRISVSATSRIIADVSSVITKLLDYEKRVAAHERKNLLITYDNTIIQLIVIFGAIVGGVLWISYAIFISIHRQQKVLENATEELQAANRKLESASYTDSLTELHNRRYFNIIFDRELKRARRSKTYFTFMMIDIDHFKKFNDTYGHLEGDHALKYVARTLQESLQRPGDFIFRLGGEEFGVLITESDPNSAKAAAKKLCETVEALQIPHAMNDASPYLTLSIGLISLIPSNTMDENIILAMADSNLYEAKENGRNSYIFTTETSNQNLHRSKAAAA